MSAAQAPDTLFRQAMEAPLTPEGEASARVKIQNAMNGLLARRDLKCDPRARNMLLACRLRLRSLQNTVICARGEEGFIARPCELREYVRDLCAASDTLLAPLGRAVRFGAPEEAVEALCAPRDIAWLVLEMICNCALHCRGEEIAVSLEPKGGRGRHCSVTLTARCEGRLDLEALHAAGLRPGSGVAAMQRIAWLHRGALLWLERDGMSVAALRIAGKAGRQERRPAGDEPDDVEMLSDPCSQVYVGLAPAGGG
ncbi:MAG: hypothetical protein LBB75_09840 [Oscillospiraceae bacterium]|nr:hypothetical protein [Oscillospiraceae bacterium]